MKMNKLKLFLTLFLTVSFFSTKIFGQLKKLDYQVKVRDSGFILLIAPHNIFLFIISQEKDIDKLFSSKDTLLYIPVQIENTLIKNTTEINYSKSNIFLKDYSNKKKDSMYYARVYIECEVPANSVNKYYRKSKAYLQKGDIQKNLFPLLNFKDIYYGVGDSFEAKIISQ
jgi:hypothetical protein